MGERSLSKYQWGIETTRGTAVAATRVAGAEVKPVPADRVWEFVRLANGRRAGAQAKRNDQYLVKDTLTFPQAYFQLWPMIGQCSLDGTITPAEQTPSQADYLWDIVPSMTAANDPDTFTLELGDDVQAYEIEYCMIDRIKYSFAIGSGGEAVPVALEVGYFGRQVTPTTFTGALALPTGLELMNGKLARLYLDTTWAGIGGTEQTSLLRGAEVEIMIGNHPKPLGSANKYFTTHGEGDIDVLVTLDLEGNASADAIFDLYQAGTERALRLDINGGQIAAGVNHRHRLDVYGAFELVQPLSNNIGGNNIHRAIFHGKEDSSGNFMRMNPITNLSTPA
jgi:hypothetical protein